MYEIIDSLPFEAYSMLLLFIFGGSVLSIFEMRKKRPGNPTVWIFPFSMLMSVSLFFYRFAIEFTTNQNFQQITDYIASICVALCLLSVVVTVIFAYRSGYVNKDKFKKLVPIIIIGFVFIAFGVIMLAISK